MNCKAFTEKFSTHFDFPESPLDRHSGLLCGSIAFQRAPKIKNYGFAGTAGFASAGLASTGLASVVGLVVAGAAFDGAVAGAAAGGVLGVQPIETKPSVQTSIPTQRYFFMETTFLFLSLVMYTVSDSHEVQSAAVIRNNGALVSS